MGTNYYISAEPCKHCGRGPDRLHIGKSSAGWCFSLHVIPELEINNLDDWRKRWSEPGAKITNEYGDDISIEDMERTILNRSWKGNELGTDWYKSNSAEHGPNGLARHQLDSRCIGHGDGTYDLIKGEFS